MKKVLVFGASNSTKSINKKLAAFAAKSLAEIKEIEIDLIDLNSYEMPIFGVDREVESGIPQLARDFKEKIYQADAIIVSFAEHNGSYTAAFKNIFDWVSRIEKEIWSKKPLLLLATSPGARGAQTVLNTARERFSYSDPDSLVEYFSLPSFNQNFDTEKGILDDGLLNEFTDRLRSFTQLF